MSTFKTHPLRAFLSATLWATLLGSILYIVGLGTLAITVSPILLPLFFSWCLNGVGGHHHSGEGGLHNQTDTDWEDFYLAQGDFNSASHGTKVGGFDD